MRKIMAYLFVAIMVIALSSDNANASESDDMIIEEESTVDEEVTIKGTASQTGIEIMEEAVIKALRKYRQQVLLL